jgi:hypothetical protein
MRDEKRGACFHPSSLILHPFWLVWLVYVAAWTWALLVPNPGHLVRLLLGLPESAEMGDVPPDLRGQMLLVLQSFYFSKGLHVTGYAVLTVLSAWLGVSGRWRWLLLAFLSAHALGTELLQNLEPSRHPSLRDVGLDHVGIALGLVLTWKSWFGNNAPSDHLGGSNPQPACRTEGVLAE